MQLHACPCGAFIEDGGALCVLPGGRAVRGLLHPESSEGRRQPDEAGLLLLSLH